MTSGFFKALFPIAYGTIVLIYFYSRGVLCALSYQVNIHLGFYGIVWPNHIPCVYNFDCVCMYVCIYIDVCIIMCVCMCVCMNACI